MMNMLGGEIVKNRLNDKKPNSHDPNFVDNSLSRFIISPNNYWNMWWNNFTQIVFVTYIFLTPIYVAQDTKLNTDHIGLLLLFDIIFMMDRFFDLFVGFYGSNGEEKRLSVVILQNISFKFFLEIVISFGPLFFGVAQMHSLHYALFKIPRYLRLFEMDG